MSGSSRAEKAVREASLAQLRAKKSGNGSNNNASSSSSSSTLSSQPPLQSRDATLASRFFAPAPRPNTPNLGKVLVPNSSPLQPPPRPLPNEDQPSTRHTNGWKDPLIASTSFSALQPQHDAMDVDDHEEPPRKRARAELPTPMSPESPGLILPGQRRRAPLASSPPVSSDTAGPSTPRSLPTIRSSPQSQDETAYKRWVMINPGEDPIRLKAAWEISKGNTTEASRKIANANWRPPPRATPVKGVAVKRGNTGKDDQFVAEKVAQRERLKRQGLKSSIYSHRPGQKTATSAQTPQRSQQPKPDIDLTQDSPAVVSKRKRATRRVVDSDDDDELVLSDDSDDDDERSSKRGRLENREEVRALEFFNNSKSESMQELTGCTPDQAAAIIALRPFTSSEDLQTRLSQGKKKAGPAGVSTRMFEDCKTLFRGYGTVDSVLEECESIGASLRKTIATWTDSQPALNEDEGAISLTTIEDKENRKPPGYLLQQPSTLAEGIQLKDYQLLGVNWLQLLYRKKLSCILADEMGLGKTIQVISFFAHLKETGNHGPHLIVVPSSTLENWVREFTRFAPDIQVQTYYGSKEERSQLRADIPEDINSHDCEVLITTYNLAQGDSDRKFFRRIEWDSCVFDEGHVLKNFQSQRYQSLLRVESKWRLLLTGTPLQNNLQELVSLMNFILPDTFAESLESLRAIFKAKGDSKVTLLAQERVSRAKKMMTPFVLRRRKDQVLKDLPKKSERIEWCEMTPLQHTIYRDALKRSRKTIFDIELPETPSETPPTVKAKAKKTKTKATTRDRDKMYLENSANVLMDFRKAALHPMLFRSLFDNAILDSMTKALLKEPDFRSRGAVYDLVKEDMTVMTDAELQVFCATYKSLGKFRQDEECYLNSGKIKALVRLLEQYGKEERKVLVFSQFTQVLDILQVILKSKGYEHLVLTGSTPVDARQSLVDEFTESTCAELPIFLLSTKAGGMGINLTAASVVIMFDQDFNPHNDRQAQDRAYRIGQKRDVEVIKLISRGTIEEDMLRLGETKLALDNAVAGDGDEQGSGESAPEREMKTSLLKVLRQQVDSESLGGTPSAE